MKFGIREICNVVYKARANMKVGNKIFYKGEPVMYFDTLKTSSLEGSVTTVYAQGGRGNARLVAWDGERTVTFTMEDALISPEGLMILTGAGLIDGSETNPIPVHVTERTPDVYVVGSAAYAVVDKKLSADKNATIYAMVVDGDEIISEPYIGTKATDDVSDSLVFEEGLDEIVVDARKAEFKAAVEDGRVIKIADITDPAYSPADAWNSTEGDETKAGEIQNAITVMLVDYYTDKGKGTQQINIGPESFGGNFYVEASTLFRNKDGVDMPAEFIIPNAKVQSNFNFSMAATGDPSTFTFTMDAFPDYTKFDQEEKVFASIQVVNESQNDDIYRDRTWHTKAHEEKF